MDTDSVVRQIWGKSDHILMIFAGASAEFALGKAVDWLYKFTRRLQVDRLLKDLILPSSYRTKFKAQDSLPSQRNLHSLGGDV